MLKEEIQDDELRNFLEKSEKFELIPVNKNFAIILVDGIPALIIKEDKKIIPHLAVLIYKNIKVRYPYVQVDAGAVKHILNGADVMRPGIIDFSEEIHPEDVVLVLDPDRRIPIAIGVALSDAERIKEIKKGKVVKTLHYYKDVFWNVGMQVAKKG